MTDETFQSLCNTYGFAPSRALREMLDTAVAPDKKLLKQALDALHDIGDEWGFTSDRTLPKRRAAVAALEERLKE
jgi:hypothetical protein